MIRIEDYYELNKEQKQKFNLYMDLLNEWNKKINLTAITEPEDIILKHFIDSLTISKYIGNGTKIIDIGTGAGFPGIPLKIYNDSIDVTLLDSLNKRIIFLNEVIKRLNMRDIRAIHGRAEDFARKKEYRERFDVATSRAVASLRTLLEYMLPFVKKDGICICMKGANITEEIEKSKNALNLLGGKIIKIEEFCLANSEIKRNIIIVKKIRNTSNKYPRIAGTPVKKPL